MKLTGKKVVITGASSGIGLELTKRLLDEGCLIVAASRHIENAHLPEDRLYLRTCDVSVKENIDQLFDYAIEKMGQIDLFIANAGFGYYEKIGEPSWEHVKHIYDTNVTSVIYSAEKMKRLRGSQPYNFLCTASGVSFLSLPGFSLYSSTKAAIRGFADAYRYELDQGQFFQLVYPIATRTNFFINAGNSPVPWPTQSVETVASCIIKGLLRDKKNIYPSRIFQVANNLSGIFPFIRHLYLGTENKKFIQWLQARKG